RDLLEFLGKENVRREQLIDASPEYFLARWGGDDVVYSIAVYLDVKQGALAEYRKYPPRFSPEWIVRDADAATDDLVERWLKSERPESDLRAFLHRTINNAIDGAAAALGLIVLGEDVTDRLDRRQKE